jgi:DNA-directed RNA polymerase alpha subunit
MKPQKKTVMIRQEYWDCRVHRCDTYHQTEEAAMSCMEREKKRQDTAKARQKREAYQARLENEVVEMREQGATFREIAEKHNKSHTRIHMIMAKAMRKKRYAEKLRESKAQVERLCPEGVDINDVHVEWLVTEIGLSVRTENCLRNARVETVGDILAKTDKEWLKVKNFGKKGLRELKDALEDLRVRLACELVNKTDDY